MLPLGKTYSTRWRRAAVRSNLVVQTFAIARMALLLAVVVGTVSTSSAHAQAGIPAQVATLQKDVRTLQQQIRQLIESARQQNDAIMHLSATANAQSQLISQLQQQGQVVPAV